MYLGFHCLLRGDNPHVTSSQHSNDIIISEEASAELSPPPPANSLITAQVETTTMTQAQYHTITALLCSLLHLPAGALEYTGHTLHPLTLHWYCAEENVPHYSTGILSAMAREKIERLTIGGKEINLPHQKVSMADVTFYRIFISFLPIVRRWHSFSLLGMEMWMVSYMLWN